MAGARAERHGDPVLDRVIEVPRFQELLHFVCRQVFEHHVAATKATVADALVDALTTSQGWEVYHNI
jgi:hypothetical protein